MSYFVDKLVNSIPKAEELSEIIIKKNPSTGSLLVELEPKNEHGKESIFIIAYDNHITISFDYYERRFDFNEKPADDTLEKVFSLVKKILAERLISVTTYSTDINISKVSDLEKPSETKKRSRKKNFRARSWLGTYDDDCT